MKSIGRKVFSWTQNFKRTLDFTRDDLHLLQRLVEWFGAPLMATPHVLSQVSDLTDLSDEVFRLIRKLFKSTVAQIEEHYDTARELVQNPLFDRFGLGDASIAAVIDRRCSTSGRAEHERL